MPNKTFPNDELTELVTAFGQGGKVTPHYNVEFKDLMRFRIKKILMVCSLYDFYTIVEDGHLQEAIFNEYLELNLHYAPAITRTWTAEHALGLLEEEEFDLIIATLRLGDMELEDFCVSVKSKYPNIPLVLLASQSRELNMLLRRGSLDALDKLFIWSGDRRIFLAMVKLFEDKYNAPVDCHEYGVTSIILVEDSPVYYSAYLPIIYTEVMKQSQQLISKRMNSADKMLRQRARPKILHTETYEQAMEYFKEYKGSLLGIITDMKFDCKGEKNPNAGLRLIEEVRQKSPDLPVLLQSSQAVKKQIADEKDIAFIDKNSRTLLMELRDFMKDNFGFGDFNFRMPDGTNAGRAGNIREMRNMLRYIPIESLLYHSRKNHFSHWFIARTEFELANRVRPVHLNQFKNSEELRHHLVRIINEHLQHEKHGKISVYSRGDDEGSMFQIIGEGSLGGKARGLAFIDRILKNYLLDDYFPGVEITIPKTMVLGTDVFAQFMELNDLYSVALRNVSDEHIIREFLKADLPPTVLGDIGDILNKVKYPIAVRSSSLLEDAMYQPFAGIYATVMIPNSSPKKEVRFLNLAQAIKFVYASTFFRSAKNYLEATGNRIEEEKMGVILQEMIGEEFDDYFFPNFSGVARSFNYYPFGRAKPKDGIVSLAMGLGKTIVDGDVCIQYSPSYPKVLPQFGTSKDLFKKSQLKYWALDLSSDVVRKKPSEDMHLAKLAVADSIDDNAIRFIASTFDAPNDRFYEGIARKGPRVIDFAPILKSNVFPLNDIVKLMLKMAEVAMNAPVEIEFAVKLGKREPVPAKFGFLQVRPMVKVEGNVQIDFDAIPEENIMLRTNKALGNGKYQISDVLYVRPDNFNAAKTRQIGEEINKVNKKLLGEKRYYLLIGPGRWGSSDPWLGIPVDFSYIAGAQVIVETQLPNMVVDPSQGSHFFQNMTSFKIAYLTVKQNDARSHIDWEWLDAQQHEEETKFIRHIALENPLEVQVDGQSGKAVVLKK